MSFQTLKLMMSNRLFMLAVFLVATLFLGNVFGYLNPVDLCFIDIDSGFMGTGQSRRAILKLRSENREGYKLLCRNINTIAEASCLEGESRYANDVYGCFANGSHIIQLPYVQKATGATLAGRVKALESLARAADAYWNE